MAGGGSYSSDDHSLPMSEINVTPLVDVMLVLLIIFMATSPMLIAGVDIDLPETSASPLSKQQAPLSITITKEGLVYLQDRKISLTDLQEKLANLKKHNKEQVIMVRGDKKIDYGRIMEVVSVIHRTGHRNISFITEVN